MDYVRARHGPAPCPQAWRVVLSGLVSLSLASALYGAEPKASYSYSRNPKAVVLFVQSFATWTDYSKSMMVYGDGRVEIDRKKEFQKGHERVEYWISEERLMQLLDIAVTYGLAEWDDTRIDAERKRSTGQMESFVSDGTSVRVTVSLASFTRGKWTTRNVSKTMTLTSPDVAERDYPAMPEYKGVRLLWEQLIVEVDRELDKAE